MKRLFNVGDQLRTARRGSTFDHNFEEMLLLKFNK